jgi:ribosome-associated translation inhibitor RaiA
MDITKKAKEEIESRLDKIEKFIASKGIGSSYLKKAQKKQRDINLSLVVSGIVTIAGLVIWLTSKNNNE